MPNPQNVKAHEFKPGQSGNPGGYSRRRRLGDALLKLIEEKGLDDPFVKVGMQEALKGDFRFWSYIFDRVDGKMTDRLEVEPVDGTQTLRDFLADDDTQPAGPEPEPADEAGEDR